MLLESIEPPPGVQPEKLLKLIESGHDSNDTTVDFRYVNVHTYCQLLVILMS